jgi:hypothetical protein
MNAGKLCILVVLAATPLLAVAQDETLQYVGSPFTSLTISGNIANGLANAPAQNTGVIVLGAPLGDNLNNVAVTPLSWSFDSDTPLGSELLDSGNPLCCSSMSFTVSTNGQGGLISWSINAEGTVESTNSPSSAAVTITNGGDSFSGTFSTPACNAPPGVSTPCFDVIESNSAPGSWKTGISPVPEIDATSSYAALSLLLGGLAVLRGGRPRRCATIRSDDQI